MVLDWCLPEDPADQSLHARLLWGIQIDELYQGTRMLARAGFLELFASAGLPAPAAIDLLSGATLFDVVKPAR